MSGPRDAVDRRRLIQQALVEIDRLEAELDAERDRRTEPIAIIGIGCRFPRADGPDAFWDLLSNGVDAVSEVPATRWDIGSYFDPHPDAPGKMSTRYGAFLDEIDRFDERFFRISPREAAAMDPQQRLLLEVAWEALEHAAQSADDLFDTAAGVFVGVCHSDYLDLLNPAHAPASIDEYSATGNASSVAAGRISYALGLRGPSLTVDTACSSSLVAVHLAARSLRDRECRIALAGGVNLILAPAQTIAFSKARMMAADGRCKAFDAKADGYVRGEGCAIVVLKRLADARADRDNILALIRGSAVNQDGRSAGLTAPNGPAQEAVIRAAIDSAQVELDDVDYVEAHGTGTALGDPIEVHALAAALACRGRSSTRPLRIGSVKTNIGHLEAAAGVAGLAKVALSLVHNEIPPHLHFTSLNPHVQVDGTPIEIPVRKTRWAPGNRPRIAGVSSFGFSGTNAHVVVEEAPPRSKPDGNVPRLPEYLLVLSARSAEALRQLAGRFCALLAEAPDDLLGDICYTAAVGRAHHDHRLAVIAKTRAEALDTLRGAISGRDTPGALTGRVRPGDSGQPSVAFVSAGEPPPPIDGRRIDLVRPSVDDSPAVWREVLQAAAEWYVRGAQIRWADLYRDTSARRMPLPTYPFQRARHWLVERPDRTTAPSVPACQPSEAAASSSGNAHPLLGERLNLPLPTFQCRLSADHIPYLRASRLHDAIVLRPSAYIEMVIAAAHQTLGPGPLAVADLACDRILVVPGEHGRTVQFVLIPSRSAEASFRIFSLLAESTPHAAPWSLHASGRISGGPVATPAAVAVGELLARTPEAIAPDVFFQDLRARGLCDDRESNAICAVHQGAAEAVGRIRLPSEFESDRGRYSVHPVLVDAAFHLLVAALPDAARSADPSAYLPIAIERITFHARAYSPFWCHARIDPERRFGDHILVADLSLLDEAGVPVITLEGIQFEGLAEGSSRESSAASHQVRGAARESVEPEPTVATAAAATGSAIRNALRTTERDQHQRVMEEFLVRRLTEVLGVPAAGLDVHEPLATFGVDSLMAMKLGIVLEQEVGVDMRLRAIREAPTIAQLSALVLSRVDEG